jgi:hypothetical protein
LNCRISLLDKIMNKQWEPVVKRDVISAWENFKL